MSRYAVRRVQCMLFRISLPCVFLTHGTWAFVVFSGLFLFSGLVFLGRMMILIRSMIATPMHTTNRSTRGNLAFSTVPGRRPPIFCEFVQWKIDRPFIFFHGLDSMVFVLPAAQQSNIRVGVRVPGFSLWTYGVDSVGAIKTKTKTNNYHLANKSSMETSTTVPLHYHCHLSFL